MQVPLLQRTFASVVTLSSWSCSLVSSGAARRQQSPESDAALCVWVYEWELSSPVTESERLHVNASRPSSGGTSGRVRCIINATPPHARRHRHTHTHTNAFRQHVLFCVSALHLLQNILPILHWINLDCCLPAYFFPHWSECEFHTRYLLTHKKFVHKKFELLLTDHLTSPMSSDLHGCDLYHYIQYRNMQ